MFLIAAPTLPEAQPRSSSRAPRPLWGIRTGGPAEMMLIHEEGDSNLLDYGLFSDEVAELTGFPCETYSDARVPSSFADSLSEAVPL